MKKPATVFMKLIMKILTSFVWKTKINILYNKYTIHFKINLYAVD